jgi:hypothetical protein
VTSVAQRLFDHPVVLFDVYEFIVGHPSDRGFVPGRRESLLFSSAQRLDLLSGTGHCFRGNKAAGGEAEHSPSSNAEVKNEWSYTFMPPSVGCHAVHKDRFVFTFTTLIHRVDKMN